MNWLIIVASIFVAGVIGWILGRLLPMPWSVLLSGTIGFIIGITIIGPAISRAFLEK